MTAQHVILLLVGIGIIALMYEAGGTSREVLTALLITAIVGIIVKNASTIISQFAQLKG